MLNERNVEMLKDCYAETELFGANKLDEAKMVFARVYDEYDHTPEQKADLLENEQEYIKMLVDIQ